jgi:hypothetical protein
MTPVTALCRPKWYEIEDRELLVNFGVYGTPWAVLQAEGVGHEHIGPEVYTSAAGGMHRAEATKRCPRPRNSLEEVGTWDLAFHTLALSLVDFDFAKDQLLLMLRNLYAHPSGQIPAYEWNFSDVNPPVHAWATLFLYNIEKELGRADLRFLERSFQGLMLNFQLVGQPQGPRGAQGLRWWFSGAGQYRGI